MRKAVTFVVATLLMIVACGGGGSIGGDCTDNASCSGVTQGNFIAFCNGNNVCTRNCNSHEDCGCAPGTTGSDIANGKCPDACIAVSDGAGNIVDICSKVCANNTQCHGQQTCVGATNGDGSSAGYSVCL